MSTSQAIINQTRQWLQQVVIKLNLCPFAAPVFAQEKVEYLVTEGKDTQTHLVLLEEKLASLENNASIETSLIIFSEAYQTFDDYLDLLSMSEAVIDAFNYTGIFQLASFHPDYCFEGSSPQDASNYSNRSPYPMLHILREASVEKAITTYSAIEQIPQNNINKLNNIGSDTLQQTLDHIHQQHDEVKP